MKKENEHIKNGGFVEIANDEEENIELQEEKKEGVEAIRRFTNDEDEDEDDSGHVSIRNIIGGDILSSKMVVRQLVFIAFCIVLMLIYTANRYSSLQDIIQIDSLRVRLTKVHYEVLTQSSELLNQSRQSNIEKKLDQMGDTMMLNNNTPPFSLDQMNKEE